MGRGDTERGWLTYTKTQSDEAGSDVPQHSGATPVHNNVLCTTYSTGREKLKGFKHEQKEMESPADLISLCCTHLL